MRLSWNEIRARAARFSDEWARARYEKGETQSFYNDFFDVFGVQRRKVASFEEPVRKLETQRGIHIEDHEFGKHAAVPQVLASSAQMVQKIRAVVRELYQLPLVHPAEFFPYGITFAA